MLLDVAYKFSLAIVSISSLVIGAGLLMRSAPKRLKIKDVLLAVLVSLICSMFYNSNPQIYMSMLTIISLTIIIKTLYKLEIISSFIIVGITLMMLALSEIILMSVLFLISSEAIEFIRTNTQIMVISNLMVSIILVIICIILSKRKKVSKLMNYLKEKRYKDLAVFFLIGIYTIAFLIIYLFESGNSNDNTLHIYIGILLIFFMVFIVINNKIKLHEVNDKYDRIFDYVQTFEKWIEEEQLVRHEYKNTLSKLLEITKDKKVKKEINKLLKANVSIGTDVMSLMEHIPQGGIKGILYYKMSLAKENGVELIIEVSETIKGKFSKISKKDYKTLCFLLGIFSDNAITGAMQSNEHRMFIEIYYQKDKFHFVISNTCDNKVDLDKIELKGYSTNGFKRGNGLHFAKNLLAENPKFIKKTSQTKKYFVQEIIY